jgi:hypothetical protein
MSLNNVEPTVSPERFERTYNELRSWLYSLVRRRQSRLITADDVHTFLDRKGYRKSHSRTRLSYINSVLREGNFDVVGRVPSERPVARRRLINAWSLR